MRKGLINFSNGAHWYRPDGTAQHDADLRVARKAFLYPSVTSIDKDSFPNLFLERWKLNQLADAAGENMRQPHESKEDYGNRLWSIAMEKARNAAIFGEKLHKAAERCPEPPQDEAILPWYNELAEWHQKTVESVIASEITLLDHEIGIAGRVDTLCKLRSGPRAVIDFKTQDVKIDQKGRKTPAFYDSWPRQLAFYGSSDSKRSGVFPGMPVCISAIIDSNPGGKVYEKVWEKEDIISAYNEFLHGAWIWFNSRRYWPVGKWDVGKFIL